MNKKRANFARQPISQQWMNYSKAVIQTVIHLNKISFAMLPFTAWLQRHAMHKQLAREVSARNQTCYRMITDQTHYQ